MVETENTISSPCKKCIKSDVCKYMEEVNKAVETINIECLSKVGFLIAHFTCKKQKIKNDNAVYIMNDEKIALFNKGE